MAIVFLGTSEFAAAILERLAASETYRPALVLSRPDRPSGRGRRVSSPPAAERARALGIALEQPVSVNDPGVHALIAAAGGKAGPAAPAPPREQGGHGQTLVVCAFGALLKEPLLSEHEILNVHPSLLPRWRGAAPIERAIMAGDARTGVSIMHLTAGLDSGPVALAEPEPILEHDTYGSLSSRLQELGGELLIRVLQERPRPRPQPSEGVTYAEKIAPEDRLLDPGGPAVELERTVRALTPHIGARVALADGTLLGVERAALVEIEGQPLAGGVWAHEERLLLACDPGTLELLSVRPPGGRPMDGAAYLRGHGRPGLR